MTQTKFATTGQDSLARRRAVPAERTEHPNYHLVYTYEHPEIGEEYRASPDILSFGLELRRGADYWIVRDVETGIYGDAEDISGAIEDFKLTAAAHLDILAQEPVLSEDLSRQLEYLRARL